MYSPESGPIEHESPGVRPTVDALVDPAVLAPSIELSLAGETSVADRRALVLEARDVAGELKLVPDASELAG